MAPSHLLAILKELLNTPIIEMCLNIMDYFHISQESVVGGGGGGSKVVATFNHVGGSFNLLWPPPGMCE